jgi:glycogen debranching enzyme
MADCDDMLQQPVRVWSYQGYRVDERCLSFQQRGLCSKPHAFFYDVTHDNETPADKRTAEDALPTGALVTFTSAAIGSTKGFDDLYPKLLNLVSDNRKYEVSTADKENGIGRVKRVLNSLHRELATGGYVEGHVHQENDVSRAMFR